MSRNYICGQFNDTFNPKRLGNWCYQTHNWKQCCRPAVEQFRSSGHLSFLADDRGHLLPEVKCQRSSPLESQWGPKVLSVWDETSIGTVGCNCKPARSTEKRGFCSYPVENEELPRYYPRHPNINCGAAQPQKEFCQEDLIEPAFCELKQIRIPIIWIVGYPSQSTATTRADFVSELVHRLGFTYIDIDKEIAKWIDIGADVDNSRPDSGHRLLKEYQKLRQQEAHSHVHGDTQSSIPFHHYHPGDKMKGDAQILFKTKEHMFHDKITQSKPDLELKRKPSFPFPLTEKAQKEQQLFKLIAKLSEKTLPLKSANPNLFSPDVFHQCIRRCVAIARKINQDHEERLSTWGIVQLIKLAMLLNYSTNGYIIEQFPVSMEEAQHFERCIWPVTCALYFKYYINGQEYLPTKKEIFEPIYVLRGEEYSEAQTDHFCDTFGDRVIKILHGDNIDDRELAYINCLIDAFLGKPSCQDLLASLRTENNVLDLEESSSSEEEQPKPSVIEEIVKEPAIPQDFKVANKVISTEKSFEEEKPPHPEVEYEPMILFKPAHEREFTHTMAGPEKLEKLEDILNKEDPLIKPTDYDKEYTIYIPEPLPEIETVHTLFPPRNPQPPIIKNKKKPEVNSSTQVPTEEPERPRNVERRRGAVTKDTFTRDAFTSKNDDTWIKTHDEAMKRTHVPLLCCADHKDKDDEDDYYKPVNGGPMKLSFKDKIKYKLFGTVPPKPKLGPGGADPLGYSAAEVLNKYEQENREVQQPNQMKKTASKLTITSAFSELAPRQPTKPYPKERLLSLPPSKE